jgi:type I restriction enzyme M protein
MTPPATKLVRKLWHYCNVLRDDGLSYPDYVEQLTYLLFLKMAEERGGEVVPEEYGWRSFAGLDADSLQRHYARVLRHLSHQDGMLGLIFYDARNKIRDPAKLRVLVLDLIGQTDWIGMSGDVKGDAYEGLLEKNAQDTKSGAGQYFTPRPLIDAIVACVRPQVGEVVCDPACGTAGFLLAAHDYIRRQNPDLTPKQQKHLRYESIRGVELVREVARLATMNLLLHGVGDPTGKSNLPISCEDSLATPPRNRVDVVLTNPPFGVKGSFVSRSEDNGSAGDLARKDFWVRSSNKQLNFLQHVHSLIKPGGRAAVVVPDNVLFEGGAAEEVRRRLLTTYDVHTLLRLPSGLFYAQGLKANVLFFDTLVNGESANRKLWVYDLRSENKFTLKSKPIGKEDLADFVAKFKPGERDQRQTDSPEGDEFLRWRSVEISWALEQPSSRLDLIWSREHVKDTMPATDRLKSLAARVAADLREALRQVEEAGLRPPGDERSRGPSDVI